MRGRIYSATASSQKQILSANDTVNNYIQPHLVRLEQILLFD